MSLPIELARYWAAQLWPASLQIAVFVALVYVISICCRRIPAQFRYTLWLLVLIRLAFPVSLQSPLGISHYPEQFFSGSLQWISGRLHADPKIPAERIPLPREATAATGSAGVSFEPSGTFVLKGGRRIDSALFLSFAWLSGILVLGLAVLARTLQLRRKTRTLKPVGRRDLEAVVDRLSRRLGLQGPVGLLQADDPDGDPYPSMCGIVRPVIILPRRMAADWTPGALEPVLLHELTHIKRKDSLVNFVQIVLQVLYFYHPMVWLANSMIRRERELACDDDVVRQSGGKAEDYVRSMLQAAEALAGRNSGPFPGIAMAENFSNLGRRVRRMMHTKYRIYGRYRSAYAGAVLVLGIFCIAVSAQGTHNTPAATMVFDPFITEQQVMPYAEFEKTIREAAVKAGLQETSLDAILKEFGPSVRLRIIRPQEWRYSLLDLLYKNNIPHDIAGKFLSNLGFYPVDTGFLDEMRASTGDENSTNSAQSPAAGGSPYKVGNKVKPPIVQLQPLPSYTEAARNARAEGLVVLQGIVRKDGTAANLKILKGLGDGLDESAIRTILDRWRFKPGTLEEQPVDVQATFEVLFRLY